MFLDFGSESLFINEPVKPSHFNRRDFLLTEFSKKAQWPYFRTFDDSILEH